jgi:hypothetical protein
VTLWFRIKIDEEVHEVRVEVPPDQSGCDSEALREFVMTTAYLEHYGRLPKGVVNSFD